jgi:drug/metabolite transporter (DMT)-like permease
VTALAAVQVFVQLVMFAALHLGLRWVPAPFPNTVVAMEARPTVWNATLIAEVVYMGVVCTALTFRLQTWALSRLTPTEAALIFALEPIFAMALALMVFGRSEWPGTVGAIGAAVTLFAVIASTLRFPRRPA